METKQKICPAVWLSGVFGAGALVHLMRLIFRVSLVVGGHTVPMAASVVIVIAFGAFSGMLLYLGRMRPCDSKGNQDGEGALPCCKH